MFKFSKAGTLPAVSGITLLASALLIAIPAIADNTIDPRIVGGQAVNMVVAPATVALLDTGAYNATNGNAGVAQFCGGTLIAEEWVLTAAHCVVRDGVVSGAADILVLAGSADITAPVTQPVTVVSVTPHPDYVDVQFGSDMALLRLSASTGQPIADLNTIPVELNDQGVTAGWGALNEGSDTEQQQFPANLQAVVVSMIPADQCDGIYPQQSVAIGVNVTPDQICAGRPGGGFDSCQGDSGGPLYRLTEAGVAGSLVGVVSFGVGCARPDFPGVYAGVRTQAAFINGTTNIPVVGTTTVGTTTDGTTTVGTTTDGTTTVGTTTDGTTTVGTTTDGTTTVGTTTDGTTTVGTTTDGTTTVGTTTDGVTTVGGTPIVPDSIASSGGSGGGCTIGGGTGQRDPLLPLLLLVSFLFVFRKLLAPASNRRASKPALQNAI